MLFLARTSTIKELLRVDLPGYFRKRVGGCYYPCEPVSGCSSSYEWRNVGMEGHEDLLETTLRVYRPAGSAVYKPISAIRTIGAKGRGDDTVPGILLSPSKLQDLSQWKQPNYSPFWRQYPERYTTNQNINAFNAISHWGRVQKSIRYKVILSVVRDIYGRVLPDGEANHPSRSIDMVYYHIRN